MSYMIDDSFVLETVRVHSLEMYDSCISSDLFNARVFRPEVESSL